MNVAWFNCEIGVAGDMLLGALIDAGAKPDDVAAAVAGLGVDGYALTFEHVRRGSLQATWANVVVDHHSIEAASHDHPHRSVGEILRLLAAADLSEPVRARAAAVFTELGLAEGAVHGIDPSDVELHEVGSIDAIVDVVGVCAALESLAIAEVSSSAIGLGHGTARTAHGLIPHPAPAVTRMLADHRVPVVGIETALETATPTGVALMVTLATGFGAPPAMEVAADGFGAGTANPPDRPNIVAVVVGAVRDGNGGQGTAPDTAHQIETNVDDVTGEVLANTITRLMGAGALDAWATPILMKKGRPAHTVSVLAAPADADRLRTVLVECTGTLGTRTRLVQRHPVPYELGAVSVDGLDVAVKRSHGRTKVEYDEAAAVAERLGVPVRSVLRRAESADDAPS